MKLRYLIYPLLAGMAILSLPSCVREDLLHEEENVIPGLETTISLKINVPDMDVATRADMAPGTDSRLNSLWVGIFSATSGECTFAKMYTTGLPQKNHGDFAVLNNIKTKSGPSYIVAVGNPDGNIGYQYIEGAEPAAAKSLNELLPGSAEEAKKNNFTWNTYQNIAISRHSIGNVVDDPTGNLPMSGIYYKDTGNHPAPTAEGWEDANEIPVVIPTQDNNTPVTLPGAIHLRRLISHVTFNISAADYPDSPDLEGNNLKRNTRIVSIVPQGYQIMNAPFTSWLHERKTQVGGKPETNSGDVISIRFDGKEYLKPQTYRTSSLFRGNQSITSNPDGSFSFDFWMLENKRRALKDNIGYDDREKEIKHGDGDEKGQNTGIYTALCGDEGEETMNNLATFVVIWCKIKYTDAGLDALKKGSSGYSDVIERTADAYYTIHLGGVKRTAAGGPDWSDFAHRRNHKYTYNVKVVDVDRIIVEARGDESKETRPGIEGVVSDIMERYDLDAHYGVFNIMLTNKDRTGGVITDAAGQISPRYKPDEFPFRLEVFYNGERIIIDQSNFKEFSANDNTNKSAKLWQWVEFRPTSGPNVLADYKPYHKKDADGNYINDEGFVYDNRTFRLNEIADIKSFPGMGDDATDPEDITERFYTVFVNEYVYEDGDQNQNDGSERNIYDETTNNWVNYVNQPPRTCWLNIAGENVSEDKESVYIKSKYIITQKSIQTFYDIPRIDANNPDVNAIGLEYLNETYGLTLDWRYERLNDQPWSGNNFVNGNWNGDKYSLLNGKVNQLNYLRASNRAENTNQIDWSVYVKQSVQQVINGINTSSYQDSYSGLQDGQIYYVPAIMTFDNYNTNRHRPNSNYVVTVMNACMNRNRDNNGNGKIDQEEVRWYLPSSGEMVDLVNGRNSLEAPFMDYGANPILYTPESNDNVGNPHHENTRFHYVSSNRRVLWAEEGITINTMSDDLAQWNRIGWQVRCTRALGTDLSEEIVKLTPAFSVDDKDNPTMIFPTYFESQTLRDPIWEAIPAHSETDKLNRISTTGFEFKPNLTKSVSYQYNSSELPNDVTHTHIEAGNRACQIYNDPENGKIGWRMPTIKECAVLKLALNNAEKNAYLNDNTPSIWVGDYEIGNFFASTYREYGVNSDKDGRGNYLFPVKNQRADKDPTGYYLGIYYEDQGTEGGNLGRAQCLTQNTQTYYVRCVRDLKPGEFPADRLQ